MMVCLEYIVIYPAAFDNWNWGSYTLKCFKVERFRILLFDAFEAHVTPTHKVLGWSLNVLSDNFQLRKYKKYSK